jgi:hypothetical protein
MAIKRLDFSDMWHLIKTQRYKLLTQDITDEVLIGLFWEESTFANIRELDPNGNDAIGFGQVNTRELWRLIGPLNAEGATDPVSSAPVSRNDHVANIMLADDGKCVELTTRMMVEFGNKRAKVLNAWSNGATSIVAKWVACEQKLDLDDPYSEDWVKDRRGYWVPRRALVTEALNAARGGASQDVVGCVPER